VVAAKGLGELRRLAVADPVGHVAHGRASASEHVGGAFHAHGRQVLAKGRVADLGVRALQLAAAGGHAASDVVEAEIGGELHLDDRGGLLEEARAMSDCGGALHCWRTCSYVPYPPRDEVTRSGYPNLARGRWTPCQRLVD
jgi:hypothetical protein